MATYTLIEPDVIEISTSEVIRHSPLTGEDLFELGDIGRAELVKGEVMRISPTGYAHGLIESQIAHLLRVFVMEHHLGRILTGEVGIYTQRDPDSVRAADVAYISNERFAQVTSRGYLDIAPELIVEIISPGDRWTHIEDKLDEYFAIDVRLVWLVNPQKREVFVYHTPTDVTRLSADEKLSGEDVLPEFEVAVAEFFE
jgi:Uma2 family endonuclease